MAEIAQELSVAIKASASGFASEMSSAANAAKSSISQIKTDMGSLNASFAANEASANAFSASVAKMMSQTRQAAAEAQNMGQRISQGLAQSNAATLQATASKAASPSALSGFGNAIAAAMQGASGGVKAASEEMKQELEGVAQKVEMVTRGFLVVAGILAGGKIFGEAVSAAANMAKEAAGLGRALGINAGEAQVLNVALKSVFLTSDDYQTAVMGVTRALNNQNNAFEQMGVKVKDNNGNFLSFQEIIKNSISRLQQIEAGSNRATAANALFGKTWQDVLKLGKVNDQVMSEARKTIEEFNTELDDEKQSQALKYRQAMQRVNEMFEQIAITVGQRVIPGLTDFASKFAEIGPTIANMMSGVIYVFQVAGATAITIFNTIRTVVATQVIAVVKGINMIGEALSRLAHFDGKGAWEALKTGFKDIVGVGVDAGKQIADEWKKTWAVMTSGPWDKTKVDWEAVVRAGKPEGHEKFGGLDKNKGDDTQQALLNYRKAQAEAAYAIVKNGLDMELEAVKTANADKLISIRDFYAQQAEIERKAIDARIATLKQEANLTAGQKPKDESARLNQMAQLVRLNSEITILEQKRGEVGIKAAHDQAQAEEALATTMEGLRAKLEQMTGQEIIGKQRELEAQYRSTIASLMAEGDTAGVELIHRLINTEISRAAFEQLKNQYDEALSEMNRKSKLYNDQAAAGLITQADKIRQVNELHSQTKAEIEKIIPAMEQYARTVGDPKMRNEVAKVKDEFSLLGVQADQVAKQLNDSFANSLSQMFEGFMSGAKSAKQVFADFAKSIASDIDKIVAKKLAEQLFGGMTGAGGSGGIGGFFSGLFNGAAFAQGGYTFGDKPILVGEHGPEVWQPPGAGEITPTGRLGGQVMLNMNVTTADAASFRYSAGQIGGKLSVMMANAQRRGSTVYG